MMNRGIPLRLKNLILFLSVLLIASVILSVVVLENVPILIGKAPYIIKVERGMVLNDIIDELNDSNRVRFPYYLKLLFLFTRDEKRIQIAEYQVDKGTTFSSLKKKMIAGDGIVYKLTVVEGSTFNDVKQFIEKNKHILHTLQGLSNLEIYKKISDDQSNVYEGKLFPATYSFLSYSKDLDLFRQAHLRYVSEIKQTLVDCHPQLAYRSQYDYVIVASLIQKESSFEPEYATISSVILNRLKAGMRLQIDASLLYPPKKSHLKPRVIDTKRKSPYNTYKHHGLPPTAIANPSSAALFAACHPEQSSYLYYVANGLGRHSFSKDFKEHIKAKLKYKKSIIKVD